MAGDAVSARKLIDDDSVVGPGDSASVGLADATADQADVAGDGVQMSADDEEPSESAQDVEDFDDEEGTGRQRWWSRLRRPITPLRAAGVWGVVVVLILGGLAGWLGVKAHQTAHAAEQREIFLQVGRQGAVNLTTIDWEHVDADVQRILDSSTGTFYDDFSQRSKPFVDVVKQVKSKTVGTVTEAGIESESDDQAQVLVALNVKTSNAGAPEQDPRGWRMRVSVQKVGDEVKVANVGFVP